MKNYVSIKEFAKLSGKSQQAIYQQLNKKLKPFVKVVENKNMLNIKALEEVYGIEVEQDIKESCSSNSTENSTINEELIAMLKAELEAKNRQLEQMQKLLDQEQQLRMVAEQRILQIEQKMEPVEEDHTEDTPAAAVVKTAEEVIEPKKTKTKSFFNKIFKRP